MIPQYDIDNWFTYHPPTSGQVSDYAEIRNKAKEFAELLNQLLPDCADKTATFRKLREVVMMANQTIACNVFEEENKYNL